jgi:hypothetical protein
VTKDQEIQKLSSELEVTPQLSPQDLVLGEMLLLCATMQGRDLLPGETRQWGLMFGKVKPEQLEWAFREHLRISKFFPRPADITELIAIWSAAHPNVAETCEQCKNTEGWIIVKTPHPRLGKLVIATKRCDHRRENA